MEQFQVRNIVVDLLVRIKKDSSYSHLLIKHELETENISQRDRALVTEIVYGTIQREMTLDYYLKPFIKSKKKMKIWVLMLLRMSVYQMYFLDKVPDRAVIHEAVEIAKQRGHKGIASLVNGILRNIQRHGVLETSDIEYSSERLSVETSHPLWLVKQWISDYGYELTYAMCHANLQKKPSSIRVQPLKISRESAMEELQTLGFVIRRSNFSNQGIVIDQGNILHTRLFKEGYVTIQDQSSMLVTEMLNVRPGMKVLDACSAPGGKATHIAEKMLNEGTIAAHDLHPNKVKQIRAKAADLSLTNIEADTGDARYLQQQHSAESFDRILIDAPCTGLGVIRDKPDIKYRKNSDDIERLSQIQMVILEETAPLLKKGGLLIYSTCTVNKIENDHVVENFLARNPEFDIDVNFISQLPSDIRESSGASNLGLQLFPQTFSTDGFYMVRIKRII